MEKNTQFFLVINVEMLKEVNPDVCTYMIHILQSIYDIVK